MGRIIGEITAAKRAAYLTRRDVDAARINNALRERQHDLESQLISQESARFANGVICLRNGPRPNPEEIFSSGGPVQWAERLARCLLARSYPTLPLNTQRLSQPITEADACRLFSSIFGQPGADQGMLGRLGPALGLSLPGSAGPCEPSGCQVFPLVRAKIGAGPAPFDEVHRHLVHGVGLTSQLAVLFLLLFVHYERPQHQIQLRDGSCLSLADGSPLLGARITPDLIPLIGWDGQLVSKSLAIGPETEPQFNDVKHHLSLLCPEIAYCDAHEADKALASSVEFIIRDSAAGSRVLDSLEAHWDGGPDAAGETGKLRCALGRLSRLSGHGYANLYHSVRTIYPVLSGLKDDLETLRQLVLLETGCGEIFSAHRFIAGAHVPALRFPNLAVDRDALMTRLSPSRLTRSKNQGWSAAARDAEAFKIRYTQAYREHHRQFHDALPGFQSGLRTAKKKFEALELLGALDELGPPTGAGLDQELAALTTGPCPCSVQENELDLSHEPCCPQCRVSLEDTVPSARLARLSPRIDVALAGKTQNLSKLLVEKALAGSTNERWREFLQIVQASELSSLANTLDSELVSFIRQVLR